MRESVQEMMRSLRAICFSSHRCCFTHCCMSYFCRLYWSSISDYLSYEFTIMTTLNKSTFNMITWFHWRCSVATDTDLTYNVAFAYTTCDYKMSESVNEDDHWVIFTKVLFRVFIHASFSYSLLVFKHHDCRLRNSSWSEFLVNDFDYQSVKDKQLLLLLSFVTRLLDKRRFTSANEKIDQLNCSRFYHESYV